MGWYGSGGGGSRTAPLQARALHRRPAPRDALLRAPGLRCLAKARCRRRAVRLPASAAAPPTLLAPPEWPPAASESVSPPQLVPTELPVGVDPCGENGEFHSFADAGPMSAAPIATRRLGAPGLAAEARSSQPNWARNRLAALTRFRSDGSTSSQLRVLRPQSGFTQSRSAGIFSAAFCISSTIFSTVGTFGE